MTTHVQSTDLDTTWDINAVGATWKLTAGTTIDAGTSIAVKEDDLFSGNRIIINGKVMSTNIQVMKLDGDDAMLQVGAHASIGGGNVGIGANGQGFELHNKGHIAGFVSGLYLAFSATIDNRNAVTGGDFGIFNSNGTLHLTNSGELSGAKNGLSSNLADDSTIDNAGGGKITGETAILFQQSKDVTITNSGLISGETAISGVATSTLTIVNHGRIKGDIMLGNDADVFDTRGGIFKGSISGGGGDDTYLVGSSDITIIEDKDGGTKDTVKSAASFALGDNLDILRLLGHKDIDGTGNSGANLLYGNSGDNLLKGMGGQDILVSGKGDDVMKGGSGTDFFVFNKGTGHDTVTDFKNGVDVISSGFVKSDADAADLIAHHAQQQGKDVLITYGNDSLLIRHMDIHDLDSGDFFYF